MRRHGTDEGGPKGTPPRSGWSGSSPNPAPTPRTGCVALSPCWSSTQPKTGRLHPTLPRLRTTDTPATIQRWEPDALRDPPNRHQLPRRSALSQDAPYQAVFGDVSEIIDAARESASRSVNAAMTAAYWLIGRRIVESEQSGEERAEYGAALIERLAEDLTRRFGRGFSLQSIYKMRLFYLSFPPGRILSTPSGKSAPSHRQRMLPTRSGEFKTASDGVGFDDLMTAFPLPWSAYVRLLSVRNESAREFYETEALREDGRSGSSTGRSAPSSTSAPHYRRTEPPC